MSLNEEVIDQLLDSQGSISHTFQFCCSVECIKFVARVFDEEEVLPVKFTTSKIVDEEKIEEDDIAKLKDALAKAEAQIAQLKLERTIGKGPGDGHELHARPLGPNIMPGSTSPFPLSPLF